MLTYERALATLRHHPPAAPPAAALAAADPVAGHAAAANDAEGAASATDALPIVALREVSVRVLNGLCEKLRVLLEAGIRRHLAQDAWLQIAPTVAISSSAADLMRQVRSGRYGHQQHAPSGCYS